MPWLTLLSWAAGPTATVMFTAMDTQNVIFLVNDSDNEVFCPVQTVAVNFWSS